MVMLFRIGKLLRGEGVCALRAMRLSRKRGRANPIALQREWSGAGAPGDRRKR